MLTLWLDLWPFNYRPSSAGHMAFCGCNIRPDHSFNSYGEFLAWDLWVLVTLILTFKQENFSLYFIVTTLLSRLKTVWPPVHQLRRISSLNFGSLVILTFGLTLWPLNYNGVTGYVIGNLCAKFELSARYEIRQTRKTFNTPPLWGRSTIINNNSIYLRLHQSPD